MSTQSISLYNSRCLLYTFLLQNLMRFLYNFFLISSLNILDFSDNCLLDLSTISTEVLYNFTSIFNNFALNFFTSPAHVAVSLSTVLPVTMSSLSYILHAGRFSFPFFSKDSRISRNRKTRADIPGLIRMPRVKTVLWLQIFGQKVLSRFPGARVHRRSCATCLTRSLSLSP